MSIIGTVSVQKLKQLPHLLSAARIAARMSQKALALAVGVDQSRLCAIERGRHPLCDADLERRLLAALNCPSEIGARIRFAAQHDRAIDSLADQGVADSLLPVVSATMLTAILLSDEERTGLANHLAEICRSKQMLTTTLAHPAAILKEVAMP